MNLSEIDQGGPVFFFLMIKNITSVTEAAVRAMTSRIKEMKISKVVGEDVGRVVSHLRGAITRLRTIGKLPHDLDILLLGRTSSRRRWWRNSILCLG